MGVHLQVDPQRAFGAYRTQAARVVTGSSAPPPPPPPPFRPPPPDELDELLELEDPPPELDDELLELDEPVDEELELDELLLELDEDELLLEELELDDELLDEDELEDEFDDELLELDDVDDVDDVDEEELLDDGRPLLELDALEATELELGCTIGVETLVGSVMPTHPAARAAGALTSSSRKLRRARRSFAVSFAFPAGSGWRCSPFIAVLLR